MTASSAPAGLTVCTLLEDFPGSVPLTCTSMLSLSRYLVRCETRIACSNECLLLSYTMGLGRMAGSNGIPPMARMVGPRMESSLWFEWDSRYVALTTHADMGGGSCLANGRSIRVFRDGCGQTRAAIISRQRYPVHFCQNRHPQSDGLQNKEKLTTQVVMSQGCYWAVLASLHALSRYLELPHWDLTVRPGS